MGNKLCSLLDVSRREPIDAGLKPVVAKCEVLAQTLMSSLGPFLLEVVATVLELSYAGDSFCCPMTFSLRVCHLKAYFLELYPPVNCTTLH